MLGKKSVSSFLNEIEARDISLKRSLTKWDLIAIGIGSVVGAGIFTVIGTSAAGTVDAMGNVLRPGAGPALVISFVLSALACTFAALCYAELASMIPVSGSTYTFAYAILGESIAWLIGWDLILEYGVAVIAVSVSWSAYVVSFIEGFGVDIPLWLSVDYNTFIRTITQNPSIASQVPHVFGYPVCINFPAVFIVALTTFILILGIKESSWVNTLMVAFKLCVLGFFIITGIFFIEPVN